MKPGLHQHIGLRQDLRINPRLFQAMDLLYMPLLDLQQHLKQELLSNPFLELVETEEEPETPATTAAEKEQIEKEKQQADEPNWEDILLDDGADAMSSARDLSEAREYIEPVPVEARDLSDHLKEQVQMLDLTPRQRLLAEEFLGNIAEDGYLGASLEEITDGANTLLREYADSLETDNRLSNTILNFNRASEELRRTVAENRLLLHAAIGDFSSAAGTTKHLTTDREGQLRQALDHFGSAAEKLDRLSGRLDSLRAVMQSMANRVDDGQGTLGKLVRDEKLYQELNSSVASLKELVEDVRAHPKKYLKLSIF